MPMMYVGCARYLVHQGREIFRCYKNDDYNSPLQYHYQVSDAEEFDGHRFDVRDLPAAEGANPENPEDHPVIIRAALDAGLLDELFQQALADDQITEGSAVAHGDSAPIRVKITTLLLFKENPAIDLDELEAHAKGCVVNEIDNGTLAFWEGDDAPEELDFQGYEVEVYAD